MAVSYGEWTALLLQAGADFDELPPRREGVRAAYLGHRNRRTGVMSLHAAVCVTADEPISPAEVHDSFVLMADEIRTMYESGAPNPARRLYDEDDILEALHDIYQRHPDRKAKA